MNHRNPGNVHANPLAPRRLPAVPRGLLGRLCAGLLLLTASPAAAHVSSRQVAEIDHQVNTGFQACPSARLGVACTADYRPAMAGDCKQAAAEKLRRLIAAGADPADFAIWIVGMPGGGRHAVLVETATDQVLDIYVPQVEPRRLKERHEGMTFLGPCPDCAAQALAPN